MHTVAAPALLDPDYLLATFGLIGLLIGFFLPGDSLLFTAGLLVSTGVFDVPLWVLVLTLPLSAIAGNLVGYWIGRKAGPAVFNRPDSRLFKQEYVDKSHDFFERYGARTIVLARFVPIVRTFATVMAGASRMHFGTYALYSVVGGILWGAGVTVLGYYLGRVAFIRDHVESIIIAIVVLSVIPIAIELLRARRQRGMTAEPLIAEPIEADGTVDQRVD